MRLIALTSALLTAGALAASHPAAAQSWKEYSYPEQVFRVSFPADPKVETTTYQASGRRHGTGAGLFGHAGQCRVQDDSRRPLGRRASRKAR